MEKPIRIRILDHEYLLKTDEDEDRVQEIADFVNDKLREVKESTDRLPEGKVAILAAFHIANDYFQLLKEHDHLVGDIQKRARHLNRQLDALSE